jgi:hypothetical protein
VAAAQTWGRPEKRLVAPLVVLVSTLASGTLLAGPGGPVTVKGKVVGWEKLVPAVYAEAAKSDSRHYTWREPSPTVKQDFRRLSANVSRDVCIVALGASGNGQGHDPLAVKVTGGRITPSTVALAPGFRLSFKNADPFPHALYESGNDKWAANPTAPGSMREWVAGAPGTHAIRDDLYPSIVMYVVVDPAVVEYAFPDREGAFTMALPPGEYSFKAFFDGKQSGKEMGGVRVERGLEIKEPLSLGGDAK